MSPEQAGEVAQEMGTVHTALHFAGQLVQAVDGQRAALDRVEVPQYSPLRTLVEQAQVAAERVQQALREAARGQQ